MINPFGTCGQHPIEEAERERQKKMNNDILNGVAVVLAIALAVFLLLSVAIGEDSRRNAFMYSCTKRQPYSVCTVSANARYGEPKNE